jgi:DNA-binding Lrp family transcriptional regulator
MKAEREGRLDPLEREILNLIQQDFPLDPRPFRALAEAAGCTENEALARVKALRERGIIRRLGGVFDSQKLGFAGTLVALQAAPEKLAQIAARVSALEGVTHNYQRDHAFNLWFTLTCPTPEELAKTLATIEGWPGVEKLRSLPALRLFKIGVNFQF